MVLSWSLYNKGRSRNPGWCMFMLKWMFQHRFFFFNSELFSFLAYLEMFSCNTWKISFILLVWNSSLNEILYTLTVALFFLQWLINRLNVKLFHLDHAYIFIAILFWHTYICACILFLDTNTLYCSEHILKFTLKIQTLQLE